MITGNIDTTLPVTIEARPKAIPINDNTKVIVQAHPFPFHKPYAMTKNAIPNGMSIILTRNPIPLIIVSNAIIVTPKGLDFCILFYYQ